MFAWKKLPWCADPLPGRAEHWVATKKKGGTPHGAWLGVVARGERKRFGALLVYIFIYSLPSFSEMSWRRKPCKSCSTYNSPINSTINFNSLLVKEHTIKLPQLDPLNLFESLARSLDSGLLTLWAGPSESQSQHSTDLSPWRLSFFTLAPVVFLGEEHVCSLWRPAQKHLGKSWEKNITTFKSIQVDLIYIDSKATQDRLWMALALHVSWVRLLFCRDLPQASNFFTVTPTRWGWRCWRSWPPGSTVDWTTDPTKIAFCDGPWLQAEIAQTIETQVAPQP